MIGKRGTAAAVIAAAVLLLAAGVTYAATYTSGSPGKLAMAAGDAVHVSCPNALAVGNQAPSALDLTCAPNPVTTTTAPVTTTTKASTTTTTTPAGGPATSCAGLNLAASCNWPGPSNTGVPAGTKLTVLTAANAPAGTTWSGGELTITGANTHIDAMEIAGAVYVDAPGVTISRSLIKSPDVFAGYSQDVIEVNYSNPAAYLTITDSEAYDSHDVTVCGAILGENQFTAIRVNLHSCQDDIAHPQGNSTIQDSWLHGIDNLNNGAHMDTLQITSGSNIKIVHNTLENQWFDNWQCCVDAGPVSNLLFQNNLLNAAGPDLYGGAAPPGYPKLSNAQYLNNHFMRAPQPGAWANNPPAIYTVDPAITFTGNVWDNTGAPVPQG